MKADSRQILQLLKTARGQIDGIVKMVEDDRYCIDVSNQLMATQSLLAKANAAVLKAHLECCVRDALASGDAVEQDEKLAEVEAIIDKLALKR